MGNKWYGISNDFLYSAEIALLRRGGLSHEEVHIHDMELPLLSYQKQYFSNYEKQYGLTQNYIHYLEINIPNKITKMPEQNESKNSETKTLQSSDHYPLPLTVKPVLILIHGYGAGGAIMYKLLKDLGQFFHVYVIDLLGFGSSGRPVYPLKQACESVEVAENFFIESLQIFIDKLGLNRSKFYLAGHSFGGYISSVYALRNPQEIEQLILLSTIGIPEQPQNYTIDSFVGHFDQRAPVWAVRSIYRLWIRNYTPFHVLRWGGNIGTKKFLKFYTSTRMESLQCQQEAQEISNYLHQIFLRPASAEYGLNSILQVGAFARNPLMYQLPYFNQLGDQAPKIVFINGDNDWTDQGHALMLLQRSPEEGGIKNGSLHLVPNAGHHFYADNPVGVVEKILVETHGEQVSQEFKEYKDKQLNAKNQQNIKSKIFDQEIEALNDNQVQN
eukprot:403330748